MPSEFQTFDATLIRSGDCIPNMADWIGDNEIDCCITSIPFGALFSYSHKREDIGNNVDGTRMHEEQFGLHMRFFAEQLYRVMRPGSIACIHIQQLLRWKVQHGYMGMRDFRGAVITIFENHGFQAHGEVAIVKNPQTVAQRLSLHSLMFVTGSKDGRAWSPAMNDYVLFFRKPGGEENPIRPLIEIRRDTWLVEPSPIIDYATASANSGKIIRKAVRPGAENIVFQRYEYTKSGKRIIVDDSGEFEGRINPDGWMTKNDWVKYARGAWEDILEIDTLDGWRCAKDDEEEKHVCPLQLEVIRRCIQLYTAPGQIVIDPFGGIGSTPYVAIEQGRRSVAFELKESYFDMMEKNVAKARRIYIEGIDDSDHQLGLFDAA